MLSGQEKAKLLLSMLGDRATAVLSLVSPANAMLLTSTIEDSPKHSPAVLSGLVTEIMGRVSEIRTLASDPSPLASGIGDGLQSEPTFSAFDSLDAPVETGGLFGALEEEKPAVDEFPTPTGPRQRTPDEIATRLMREKPQVAAFVLSRFDDTLRESVVDQLTYEFRDQIARIKVDRVPLSDAVFSKIYDQIVIDDGADSTSSNQTAFGQPANDTSALFSFS